MSSTNTIKDEDKSSLLSSVSNSILKLILIPTMQCNMRCDYCYETHSELSFSRKDIQNVFKYLSLRAASLDYFCLGWFGGEPLLKYKMVKGIMLKAKDICQKNSIKFESHITTNASLLNKIRFKELVDLGCRHYHITLDGNKENHDKVRTFCGGRGSFDAIWENLLAMRETKGDFEVLLRIHVYGNDIGSLKKIEKLVDDINKNFGKDKRFSYYFRNLFLSEKNKNTALMKNDIFRKMGEDKLKTLVPTSVPNTGKNICYAAQTNHWVVYPGCKLLKCTVAIDDDINYVGKINSDGTLALRHDNLSEWNQGLAEVNWQKLECPLKFMKKTSKNEIEIKLVE